MCGDGKSEWYVAEVCRRVATHRLQGHFPCRKLIYSEFAEMLTRSNEQMIKMRQISGVCRANSLHSGTGNEIVLAGNWRAVAEPFLGEPSQGVWGESITL